MHNSTGIPTLGTLSMVWWGLTGVHCIWIGEQQQLVPLVWTAIGVQSLFSLISKLWCNWWIYSMLICAPGTWCRLQRSTLCHWSDTHVVWFTVVTVVLMIWWSVVYALLCWSGISTIGAIGAWQVGGRLCTRWRGAGVPVTLNWSGFLIPSIALPPVPTASHRHRFDPSIVCQITCFMNKWFFATTKKHRCAPAPVLPPSLSFM